MVRTLAVVGLAAAVVGAWTAPQPPAAAADPLDADFTTTVRPFLDRYCVSCHGPKRKEAELDLSRAANSAAVAADFRHWELVAERLKADEMPPDGAPRQPKADERTAVLAWLGKLREREIARNAGDPGPVLAHRLSNAEYDYTIRDLTGVDIRPTRDFPVDPANQAGFDNSGESLAMSPALLKKYLAAARHVADHVVFKPDGLAFAPHPVVTDTDRDKYCVQRIVAFYDRHRVDTADYFLAAWKYRHRATLGKPDAELATFTAQAGLSPKYLALVWAAFTDADADAGPLAVVRAIWNDLPPPDPNRPDAARPGCEQLRDLVVRLRAALKPDVPKLTVSGISQGSQPFVLWRNRRLAELHRAYAGDPTADSKKLAAALKDEPELAKRLDADPPRDSLSRFCAVFPDAFVVTERGPFYDPGSSPKGRLLSAGFHLMHGYYRDDGPLCDLILTDAERREIDALWAELDFVTLSPQRQYRDFIFFERAEPPRFMFEAEFDFARSEDKDATSEAKMRRLADAYLAKARQKKPSPEALGAIETYFSTISADVRRVEKARLAAEPSHLAALAAFAERAYRRPLTPAEREKLLGFYRTLREKDGLSHEDALRDALASVLLSPHFCFRHDPAETGRGPHPLSGHALANRLSYFLWSSLPDEELLAHAASGDLRKPDVLLAQTRRMLRDPKVRGLATEFAGHWLDFRRFEEHNAVDRERFPTFTPELRQAMFEEPVRYLVDVAQRNRPVLDLLHGTDTFVNRPLAKHYGMPFPMEEREPPRPDRWVHVPAADKYGRGGLLPMAVFLTKNAPGLRTSPVKRGYWVVSKVLGERIPSPPPAVPELPKDEANLGALSLPQLLARHRADKSCAGCHNRFDSVGLAFEGFGPVGERRTLDLGGKPVQTRATFPDGTDRDGLAGLRDYLRTKRQGDFLDAVCRKLFAYALGRSLVPSDEPALAAMRARLAAGEFRLGVLVEAIVTTPQFLTKRGRDDPR
jgi:mono/diheme cytochrome c family protein